MIMHWRNYSRALALVIALFMAVPSTVSMAAKEVAGTESESGVNNSGRDTEKDDNKESQPEESKETGATETPEETKETGEPEETEAPEETEEPKETEEPEETEEPKETEEPEETEAPEETEETKDEELPETERQKDDDKKDLQSNEALIERQNIIIPPKITEDFRFVTVEKDYALIIEDQVLAYEEKDEASEAVGRFEKNDLCFILADKEKEWVYIESGDVRGFVKAGVLLMDEQAAETIGLTDGKEAELKVGEAIKEPLENQAFLYTKTTVYETVIDKVYAICSASALNIREEKHTGSRIIGLLPGGALCYIIADEDDEWIYIESGDVRGFVYSSYIEFGEVTGKQVEEKGEASYITAREFIAPEENKACYYTITSVKERIPLNEVRQSIVEYALQFVGNPYVWGGTSLTNGADCSGYVQSIYREYGYSLPRVAEDQARYGMQIPVPEAAPGDLIFYAKNGYVYHVVMFIGNGKVVHANSSKTGIIVSAIDNAHAVWATRILQ